MSNCRKIVFELRSISAEHVGVITGQASVMGVGTICLDLVNGSRVRLQDAFDLLSLAATIVFATHLFATNNYTSVLDAHRSFLLRQLRLVALGIL